jgi:hypothetical protein
MARSYKKEDGSEPKVNKKAKKQGYVTNMGPKFKMISTEWWEAAEEMARIQCTQVEIAGVLKLDQKTLEKKIKEKYGMTYSEWSTTYGADGRACLRRRLFQMAMNTSYDNTNAAIWLSKQHIGMKEPESNNSVTNDTTINFAYSKDELRDAKRKARETK